ncbi:MAG: response regulator [Betaproteobacteria bacterium]|nr:response regulator [Betaproteobacteria bacterium]
MSVRAPLLARKLIFTVGTGFALALGLIITLAVVGLLQLAKTQSYLEAIAQENTVKTRMATQMRDLLRDRAVSMLNIAVLSDPFDKDQEMLRFYQYGSAYQQVKQELTPLIHRPREKAVIASLDRITRANQPVMVRTVELAMSGDRPLAFRRLQEEAIPLQRQLVKELDAFIEIQHDMTNRAMEQARTGYAQTRALMLLLGIVAVLTAALVANRVVRRTVALAAETERERTKFETLFETNTDGIVILDRRGFRQCNPATLEMFRMGSQEEFLQKRPEHLGEAIQPDGQRGEALAQARIQEAMEHGHAFFQWQAKRPDGSAFPAEIALHAMTLDGETVLQAILRDVTVQKEVEVLLKMARDEAMAMAQMKSQFVANVSHEIRTPMNGILGMSQLLLNSPLNARQKEYAEAVSTSAQALMRIINDILDFSKIEAGRLTLEIADFNLGDLAREVIALYTPRAEAKGLALRLEWSEGLPAWVRGDALRLRQILLNLLDNALKFTQEGEVRLRVDTAPDPDYLRFSVQDTGLGIPEEQRSRIFHAFAQGDGSVSRRFGGTGLGLAICRQLAELMGGDLELENLPPQGSAFHLTVPLPPGAAPAPLQQSDARPALAFPGVRVLVAEDNPVNQKVVAYLLEDLEVEAVIADDGRRAFELLAQEQVDLVLMDGQMPDWDGLTATRAIRAREREQGLTRLPIIALTANAMPGFADTCAQAGMDDCLLKPLKEAALAAVLERWLPGRSVSRTPPQPAPIPAERSGLIDLPRLHKLCRGNPMQMRETLDLFVSSTETLLEALSQAIVNRDAAQTARQAHQIRGAAAYLGAEAVAEQAQRTESAAKAADWDSVNEALEDLEAAFIAVRLEILAL